MCPRLLRGAYFGEIALIGDKPRAATITAVVPSRCAVMDRAAFLRLIGPMKELLNVSDRHCCVDRWEWWV